VLTVGPSRITDRQTRNQCSTEAPILWQHNIIDSYATVGRIVYGNESGTAGVWIFSSAQHFVFVHGRDFPYTVHICTTLRIARYSCYLFSNASYMTMYSGLSTKVCLKGKSNVQGTANFRRKTKDIEISKCEHNKLSPGQHRLSKYFRHRNA
jgi:hypothetical protein